MLEIIKSSQNQRVKVAASLKQKKYRDETGLFLLEGIRLVEEMIRSDWECESFFVAETFGDHERSAGLLAKVQEKGAVYQVSDTLLAKICDTREPQGIVGIAKQKQEELVSPENKFPFWVLADEIQDPGNLGTLIRTADAAGCDGLLLVNTVDLYNPKVVRSSMGSLFHLPVVSVTPQKAIEWLKKCRIDLYGTSVEEAVSYYKVDWREACCIVFGNEGNGMSQAIKEQCQGFVHIPLFGQAESLNVSISAAVILYEAVRQRCFSS